ncbi:MAG: DUF1192 domain-containing protein [Alphaproteobacteria bacterium]|nr:DUF1192 domain-containing protein [Alphaproteobacteria bacterium]
MFDDEEKPRPRAFEKRVLDPLSLEELEDYIADLETEIARCREAIASKKGHRGAADALFSKP